MSNEEYARIVEPRTGTERGDIRGGWVTADVRRSSRLSKAVEIRLLECETPTDALARFDFVIAGLDPVPFTEAGVRAVSDTLRPY